MENKKTKLTISGNTKKPIKNIELARNQNKNSVIIEKKTGKFSNRSSFVNKPYNKNTNLDDCKMDVVQVVKSKKQSFGFLNVLNERKNMVVSFIIFIIILYVFTANRNVVLL